MSNLQSVKKFYVETFVYGLGYAIKKLIGFILLPFYTAVLSPSDYGILETVGSASLLVIVLFNFGIDTSCSRYFYSAKTEVEKGKVLFTSLILRLFTIIPSVVLSFFSERISVAMFGNPTYTWVVFITCMTITVSLLSDEQGWIYRFYHKPWGFNLNIGIKTFTNLGLGILLVISLRKGIVGAQLATLLSSLIAVLVSVISFTRKKYTLTFSFFWAKKMLKLGYPLLIAGVVSWLFTSADRFFLLHYQNTTQIGIYSIGTAFVRPISIVNMAIGMSFYTFFMTLYENEEDEHKSETKRLTALIWYSYLVITVTIGSFLSIFGRELISTFTTKQYTNGAAVIALLMFSSILRQSQDMTSLGIILKEKTKYYTFLTLISVVISLASNFILIPAFSYIGAAFSNFLSNLIIFIAGLFISNKMFPVKYSYFKIILYLLITFLINLGMNMSEFYYNFKILVYYKVLIMIFIMVFPFTLGIINKRRGMDLINGILSFVKK